MPSLAWKKIRDTNGACLVGLRRQQVGKLTPREREKIRTGYPDLPAKTVALMFGVHPVTVWKLRGRIKNATQQVGRKRRNAHATQLAYDFLVRAVPLMRSTLRAELELEQRGVYHNEFERVLAERKWRDGRTDDEKRADEAQAREQVHTPRRPYSGLASRASTVSRPGADGLGPEGLLRDSVRGRSGDFGR